MLRPPCILWPGNEFAPAARDVANPVKVRFTYALCMCVDWTQREHAFLMMQPGCLLKPNSVSEAGYSGSPKSGFFMQRAVNM
jgi:hypothetical protein